MNFVVGATVRRPQLGCVVGATVSGASLARSARGHVFRSGQNVHQPRRRDAGRVVGGAVEDDIKRAIQVGVREVDGVDDTESAGAARVRGAAPLEGRYARRQSSLSFANRMDCGCRCYLGYSL